MKWERWINTVHEGDALTVLRQMPDEFVQCCVTSPPYWGLRTYGVEGQLGLEQTPEEYVSKMVEVFREVRRVLRKDGTLWLNMGDSYAGGGQGNYGNPIAAQHGQHPTNVKNRQSWLQSAGYKPKDLCGIPWRLAFALQADGWWLRSDIIWNKPNPMPESVTDRPTKSHEYIFLLTKSKKYFYDQEAVKIPSKDPYDNRAAREKRYGEGDPHISRCNPNTAKCYATANLRSVWTFSTKPYPEAHFATFPPELPRRCILAGTSAKGCCPECGSPWVRVVEKQLVRTGERDFVKRDIDPRGRKLRAGDSDSQTLGWQPTCICGKDPIPCPVLDPFLGSGTVVEVAIDLDRDYVGIDLNPEYLKLAEKRIGEAVKRQKARLAQEVLNL